VATGLQPIEKHLAEAIAVQSRFPVHFTHHLGGSGGGGGSDSVNSFLAGFRSM